jgi:hypothetical protein
VHATVTVAVKGLLDSIGALWRKAEREAYRSFHAKSKTHKADHFFNFCVTAHSLRDFFFEHEGISGDAERTRYHAEWNTEPLLVSVADIANLSKHFQLRDRRTGDPKAPRVRRVVHRRGTRYDVYITPTGAITLIPSPSRDIVVTTGDGSQHELWAFQIDVLDHWRAFMSAHGIRIRRQTVQEMLDHEQGA